jgi:gliding motility-associated-like protein
MVIGSDQYKCFSDTAYVTVAVGSYPTVNLGTGALVVAGTPVVMDPILTNGPFLNYTWTPVQNLSCTNCPKPIATINTNITYKLEVENVYGCMASDTISYTVQCEEASQLFVPNAFSPDNDGLNDVLMVRGKGLASVKYFRIFNRWGQLVFEKNNFNPNDPNHGWDGKVNGVPANPEVYVYTAEVVCTAGGVFVKKGNVTLFR